MKLNELSKRLYCYGVDNRYKRGCGDDNDDNTNSIDVSVDLSTCPNPEIVEWMKNARSSHQDHCDRLADKDYDSFSSEDYDYFKVKIAFSLFGSPSNLNEDDNEVKISSHNEGSRKCTNPIFDRLS